jgi:enediyne biosynthesis protein E4
LVEGDAKGLADLRLSDGSAMVLAAQNNSVLKTFVVPASKGIKSIAPQVSDAMIEATYSNGKKLKYELHYGSGYLSQSSRKVSLAAKGLVKVTATDFQGMCRNVAF